MNCVKSSGVQNQTNERDLSQLNTSSVECNKNVQQKIILWVDVQHFLFPSDGVQSSAMYVFHHVFFFANIYNSSLIVAESFSPYCVD